MLVDDRNPNHRDDAVARKNGFPSRIASGGMATHLLGEYISRKFGIEDVESVVFRLSQPMYPGQTLEIGGYFEVDGESRRFKAVVMADGQEGASAAATLRSLGEAR